MPDYPSSPSLTSLMQDSRRVPPLAHAEFEQRHLGLRVCWRMVFVAARPLGTGTDWQILATQRTLWMRFGCTAFFEVDPDRYPDLSTAMPGRRLRVCGSIRELRSDSVVLDAESVEVLATSIFDRYRY